MATQAARRGIGGMLLVLAACPDEPDQPPDQPDPIPGYVLTLKPQVLDGTDPFPGSAEVSLLVEHDGDVDITMLGSADDSLSLPELPLLERGDRIGLLVEEPGGEDGAWDPDLTLAYGQLFLEEDVPTDGGDISVDVLVTPYGEVTRLGVQGGNQQRICSTAAMAPGGDVFVFGGADPSRLGTSSATPAIFSLRGTDDGTQEMSKEDAGMPDNTFGTLETSEGDRYCGARAIAVDDDDGSLILVTGGRSDYNTVLYASASAFLFDPVERDWVREGGEPLVLEMKVAMTTHRSVVMSNGHVVLFGGVHDDSSVAAITQVYDPGRRRFFELDASFLSSGVYEPTAATLGDLGAMVCGGAVLPPPAQQATEPWVSVPSCYRVSLDRNLSDLANLPVPLTHHAMVELADGRVLLTGGVEQELSPFINAAPGDASRKAYLYDPQLDQWEETGIMVNARAGHEMLALPDGGALVIGGVDQAGVLYGRTGETVGCWERFDGERFVEGGCDGVGEGFSPVVATYPGDGAFVLSGLFKGVGGEETTGSFGLVATGPQ